MTTIVTRSGKGSPLTNTEVDTNFTNLNSAKLEAAVTSVAALTIGTTGTDLSSTVATGTTTPVISLQVPTASATNRGALSAADWTTFNGKQPAGSYLTTAVTSAVAGTGISVSGATGAVTFANTGVTSIVAGTGISISGSTGAVTVTNTVTGASITDDTTTATAYYPLFSTAVSGSLSAVKVSSTKYTYTPSTGTLSATVMTASSDERLKTNWKSLPDNFVSQLANVKSGIFDRIDFSITDVGVGAQSLQTVLPEAVVNGADGYLSVNYGGAALVAAIELAKQVQELRAEITILKAKVGK